MLLRLLLSKQVAGSVPLLKFHLEPSLFPHHFVCCDMIASGGHGMKSMLCCIENPQGALHNSQKRFSSKGTFLALFQSESDINCKYSGYCNCYHCSLIVSSWASSWGRELAENKICVIVRADVGRHFLDTASSLGRQESFCISKLCLLIHSILALYFPGKDCPRIRSFWKHKCVEFWLLILKALAISFIQWFCLLRELLAGGLVWIRTQTRMTFCLLSCQFDIFLPCSIFWVVKNHSSFLCRLRNKSS